MFNENNFHNCVRHWKMRTKEKENVEFCLLIWNFMLFEVGLMCWVGGFSMCWNKSIKVSAVSFAKVTHKKRILWLHYSLCARLECRQLIALWEQARRLPFYVDVLIFHCDNDADEKVFFITRLTHAAAANANWLAFFLMSVCYSLQTPAER